MLTSKQMRHYVPVMLALILVLGGICGALCFAQAPDGAAHSCCHEKNHCGHAGPVIHSDQAAAVAKIAPAVVAEPLMVFLPALAGSESPVQQHRELFSPPVRTTILRL